MVAWVPLQGAEMQLNSGADVMDRGFLFPGKARGVQPKAAEGWSVCPGSQTASGSEVEMSEEARETALLERVWNLPPGRSVFVALGRAGVLCHAYCVSISHLLFV